MPQGASAHRRNIAPRCYFFGRSNGGASAFSEPPEHISFILVCDNHEQCSWRKPRSNIRRCRHRRRSTWRPPNVRSRKPSSCTKVIDVSGSNRSNRDGHVLPKERPLMFKRFALIALGAAPLCLLDARVVSAQPFPMIDQLAQRVVEKYQNSSCQQLAEERSQPKAPKGEMEQRAISVLRSDPQMRTEFINRVAAPVANKLFECGLIP